MKKIVYSLALLSPAFALAQAVSGNVTNADTLIGLIMRAINAIIPIIIALAVLYLVYSIFTYAINTDEEKRGEAKNQMIYGIIALFVMVSIWGLVNILKGTFGFTDANKSIVPYGTGQDVPGLK